MALNDGGSFGAGVSTTLYERFTSKDDEVKISEGQRLKEKIVGQK